MARFEKKFAKPGKVVAKDALGRRKIEVITKERIAQMVKTGNAMVKDGLLIPAPYGHKDEKGFHPVPIAEAEFKDGTVPWSKALNSGFWSEFRQDPETGEGIATIEADGDPEDIETHAGKINKTYKQVSPFFAPEYVDGMGKTRKEALLHICVTNKAVVPNQEPFRLLPSEENLATAMSFDEDDVLVGTLLGLDTATPPKKTAKPSAVGEKTDDDSDVESPTAKDSSEPGIPKAEDLKPGQEGEEDENVGNGTCLDAQYVSKIVELAKSRLGWEFPDDTDESNVLDRLLAILTNQPEKETTGELPEERPEGSELPSQTIMSLDLETKATKLLAGKTAEVKQKNKGRIEKLVKTGRIGQLYADEALLPLVEGIALSLDDMDDNGNFPKTSLELSLDTLEQQVSLIGEIDANLPPHLKVLRTPHDFQAVGEEEVPQDQIDATIRRHLGS